MGVYVYVLVMAVVTYLVRMLPFTFFRKKIENRFLKSFFYYVPYAVLGAMTFPWVLYSTGSFITAAVGCIVAVILSLCNKSIITVALSASVAAYITSLILTLL